MLKPDEIPWNSVIYEDCMNEENGLPTLPHKSIDLAYIDYPWGSGMKPNKRAYHDRVLDNDKNKYFFDDTEEVNNQKFRLSWFFEVERICKRILLVIPEAHKRFWYRNTEPLGDVPVLWKNGFSSSKVARNSRKSTYMLYGKFSRKNRFAYDYLAKRYNSKGDSLIEPYTLGWGFCNEEKHLKHPSPKGIKIALDVLDQLKPESLLDPFCGSGSYLKAADILDVKWLGYELDPKNVYWLDVEWRFAQKEITNYLEVK